MLHNLNFACPIITTYITDCYIRPARLFIIGGGEILPKEGKTQGDPTALRAYAFGILPLTHFLLEFISTNYLVLKRLPLLTILQSLVNWLVLETSGENYQFLAQSMVTSQKLVKEDAVIGINEYRKEYVKDLINDWNNQIVMLSSIAESQPQIAYSAFVSGFKSKLNYFMRTISSISQFLYPGFD